MKIYVYLITLLSLMALKSHAQDIKVMSYNLRYDTPQDGVNQWGNRKEKVFSLLKKYDPDVLGVQEALLNQLQDIQQNSNYEYVGVGRDDGKTKGEYSAIFYKKARFTVLEQNTFWLSESPTVPGSKSWDAAITRVATWAKLEDKKTKKIFFFLNTHFDHIGKIARMKSAELIREKIESMAGKLPVIITGDFNAEPSEEPYAVMTRTDSFLLLDAGKGNTEGTYCTFFVNGDPCKRIDYIFHSTPIRTKKFQVIADNDGKHYPSDHLPVMATVQMKKK